MDNKRDQVQAHMFMMGRLTSGMLRADPDAAESPQGRTNRGIMWGLIIGAVVAAGAFVLGLISPAPSKGGWREDGTVVVEKETGSRYLYLSGRLRPLRNYASAKLLLGADMKVETIKASELAGTPYGAAVGIPGAPERLPSGEQLSEDPWQLCSSVATARDAEGQGSGAVTGPATTLAVAHRSSAVPLNSRQGLLVTGPDGEEYVLWKGSKLRVDPEKGAGEALGYGSLTPATVSGALLSALPAGPNLTPKTVPGLGDVGPVLDGRATRIGQLFRVAVPGGTSETYQLQRDGLSHLTATQAALALGDPRVRDAAYDGRSPEITELGSDVLKGRLAPADTTVDVAGLPPSPPDVVPLPAGQQACVQIVPASSGEKGTSLSIGVADEPDLGPVTQPSRENLAEACLPVGRVTVPPGRGVLVKALSAAGGNLGTTLYLVTDTGVKHRVVSLDAAEALGYGAAAPTALPSLLLSMLPSGPDLSSTAAEVGRAVTTGAPCREQSPVVAEIPSGPATPGASTTPPAPPAKP